ncbi:hypothetical protein CsSME_00016533 [Camellia sinensis var. sinensis]
MQTNCAHQCAKGLAPSKDLRSPRPSEYLCGSSVMKLNNYVVCASKTCGLRK